MQRLHNKIALITGAAGGIGRATALRLASEGAWIAALDLSAAGLDETVAQVTAQGSQAIPLAADLTNPQQVRAAIEQIASTWGRIDILFNGAGASGRRWGDGPVDTCTETGWDQTIAVNLTSVFLACKYAIPHLLAAGHGSVINVSSVLGLAGGDADFATHAYATAKAGIIGLSRSMATYYAPRGLRVNVIAPGLIATPRSQRAQNDQRILERMAQLQPLTGTFGTPEDVAATAAYLASDDSRFVTGQIIAVDGGWTAQ